VFKQRGDAVMDTIQPSATGRKAYTIDEFCLAHGFSRAFFYQLKKRNKAPVVTRLSAQKQIITDESAAAWRQAMTAQSAA